MRLKLSAITPSHHWILTQGLSLALLTYHGPESCHRPLVLYKCTYPPHSAFLSVVWDQIQVLLPTAFTEHLPTPEPAVHFYRMEVGLVRRLSR